MCGITGYLERVTEGQKVMACVSRMNRTIARRSPDDDGTCLTVIRRLAKSLN